MIYLYVYLGIGAFLSLTAIKASINHYRINRFSIPKIIFAEVFMIAAWPEAIARTYVIYVVRKHLIPPQQRRR